MKYMTHKDIMSITAKVEKSGDFFQKKQKFLIYSYSGARFLY